MAVTGTLCWIIKDGKVLLKLANSGISDSKWNAPGGKLEDGETPLDCVTREVSEETGLRIINPKYHGILRFFFGKTKEPDWIVHVFSTRNFVGELREGDEGKLHWFNLKNLPFKEMWADDKYWVPLLLQEKRFNGYFYFDEKGKEIRDFDLWVS